MQILRSVENKRNETIVYVDFAHAFDTVSHEKLQLKLQACGISGQLLLLISNFFVRSQSSHQSWSAYFTAHFLNKWRRSG